MRRDDLYITVPSFFRCPISLDVMKSPVSLCTGVTYDRSSIQRWLDCGNNTCPATMQILQTKDLVPNHTLQRLIQIWSDSVKTRQPPSSTESHPSATSNSLLSQSEVKALIDQLKNNLLQNPPFPVAIIVQCINKLMFFAKSSDQNCNFLFGSDSELLSVVISRFNNAVSVNLPLTEKLVQFLHLLLKNYRGENNQFILVEDKLVASMIMVLRQGKMESKILVSAVLKMFADMRVEYRHLLGENEDVYAELLKLIVSSEWNQEAVGNSLSCLLSVSSIPKRNRMRLVRAGAVGVLTKALCEGELSVSSVEKVLKLLEMVSTCKDGRTEICGDDKCVGSIVKKVLKISTMATEHAVTILWSLCCLFRDQKAQESVAKSNGLAKILLLLQSNVSPAARQMCSDLLKVFRVNSKNSSCLSSYDTKTTHIMPF